MWPFKRDSGPSEFWRWFQKRERALFDSTVPNDAVYRELRDRLSQIHESLTYEVGPPRDGVRELVISADGDRSAFFAVEEVVDRAPPLDRWTIIRFRPRNPDYASFRIRMDDMELGSPDVEYQLLATKGEGESAAQLGLRLFVRGCPERDHRKFAHVAFLMLDTALGEYDMETKVGMIEVLPWEHESRGTRRPFEKLQADFDRAFEQILESQKDR